MGLREEILARLTLSHVVLGLVAYVLLKFVYQIVYYHFFHPLSVFPGPFWGGVTRLWIAWHNLRETELPTVYALTKKYATRPNCRTSTIATPTRQDTTSPEVLARRSHCSTCDRIRRTQLFESTWRDLPQYSFTNVKKMEPLVDIRIQHWIDKLNEKFAQTGEIFDFSWWAVYMAYDIISEIGFGAPFGFVEQGQDVGGLIQGFHDGLPAFGLLARLHPFTSWMKTTFMKKYLVATPQDDSGIGVLMRFRDRLIDQRFRELEAKKDIGRIDLLQTFIEARTEDGSPLDMEYLKAEVLLVLLAGADTTGTVFQALVHFLLTHRDAYRRLMEEIDAATAQGLISDPVPQYDEIVEHLPYYVACVRETLRLNPPAPNIFPRYVSEPGMDLYGKFAPAGTEISGNPWIMQRDKKLYGEDAEEFKPERWLDAERAKRYNKYSFTFGYGARVCLGRDIAMMELYKGPLQFFRRYHVQTVTDKPKARFVIKGGVGFYRDVWVTIDRRLPQKA
ncbi:cytochrome P450 monooxygenase, putative [Aspergillus fumigatus A1163]|uniref:Cytochrome P450 monooxygenase, putative n=1 Tax=Aspergillus fumigatus (strain CBS 144.89 / FGSC A1163 / CEA10) TaxID=451804 RepID=B0YBB3_ASPFC|nr:cytochrome P450 monooxygenase, putative [Aspergillus fumigatus A1163]KEY81231.1 cytochrome P450 monooxygenase [Aspergillus fumigatus]